jgi:hypothetical protein
MVKGLDRLREHFYGHQDKFIIIGGTACEIRLESRGIAFRATTDIDMVLVIESIDPTFLEIFWAFIREGKYQLNEFESERKNLFRFSRPNNLDFPATIELFTRKPEGIILPEGFHLTPFPQDGKFSGMSAMLLDDDYYYFTIHHSDLIDGLRIAREPALICLKSKAFLNNLGRKEKGEEVRQDDIAKHKKDVLKLGATLPGGDTLECPEKIRTDIRQFITRVQAENPNITEMVKSTGLGNISLTEILDRLASYFRIKVED